jgi:hypothetical protein
LRCIIEDPERAKQLLSEMLQIATNEESIRNDADSTVREDEIGALLKIDKASLYVRRSNHNEHTALIKSATICFTRTRHSRIDAAEAVWTIYQEYMDEPLENRNEQRWLMENAEANVEVQMIKNIKDPDDREKTLLTQEAKMRIQSKE